MGAPEIPNLCGGCRHFVGMLPAEDDKPGQIESDVLLGCAAFREGIPDAIAENEIEHRKPYPGDHGIQFEPIEDKPNE